MAANGNKIDRAMKIKVWTNQPDRFISETRKLLLQHSKTQADTLPNGQRDGDLITFAALSEAQFCALEDAAVRMGLQYDGSQKEQEQEPAAQSEQVGREIPRTSEQFQAENEQLRVLLHDYYVAAQIGMQMEDPSDYDVQLYTNLMQLLQQRAIPLLGINEADAAEDLECVCGVTIASLIRFFGPDYHQSHLTSCGECGEHTLHVSDESERCVNPACQYSSSVTLKKKSPLDKLRETKTILSQWIEETQAELRTPAEPGNDELWRLDSQDSITGWTAQRALVEWLETHPEAWTAGALEDQLRLRFRRINEIHAALQALPSFYDEEELNYTQMDETERGQRQQVNALQDEQYTLDRQCDLLARFLGISERRIHDVRHITLAHYENEETRTVTKKVEAATYYPLIESWIAGTGTLKTLPIPAHFSNWMPEYPSPFPTLI